MIARRGDARGPEEAENESWSVHSQRDASCMSGASHLSGASGGSGASGATLGTNSGGGPRSGSGTNVVGGASDGSASGGHGEGGNGSLSLRDRQARLLRAIREVSQVGTFPLRVSRPVGFESTVRSFVRFDGSRRDQIIKFSPNHPLYLPRHTTHLL